MDYRGRSGSNYGNQRRSSFTGSRKSRGKPSGSVGSIPQFIQANIKDETMAGPEYREQADMLERAGYPEEAMLLRFIASQEDSHKAFFEDLAERGIGAEDLQKNLAAAS